MPSIQTYVSLKIWKKIFMFSIPSHTNGVAKSEIFSSSDQAAIELNRKNGVIINREIVFFYKSKHENIIMPPISTCISVKLWKKILI